MSFFKMVSNYTLNHTFPEEHQCYLSNVAENMSTYLYYTFISVALLNIITAISAVSGNLTIIYVICKKKELQTKNNLLLGFLGSSDCMVGLFLQPMYIVYLISMLSGRPVCLLGTVLIEFAETYLLGLSLWTLAALTCDRLVAIFFPFFYSTRLTHKHIVLLVSGLWLIWSLLLVGYLFIMFLWDDKTFGYLYIRIIGSSAFLFVILFVTIVNINIFKLSRKHRISIASQEQVKNEARNMRKEKKVARTMLLIILVLALCVTPAMCLLILQIFGHVKADVSIKLWPWFEALIFFNSSANPCIYCFRISHIRRELMGIFRFRIPEGSEPSDRLSGSISRRPRIRSCSKILAKNDPTHFAMENVNDEVN